MNYYFAMKKYYIKTPYRLLIMHCFEILVQKKKAAKRRKFETMLDIEGFVREDEEIDDVVYCKLHCSFPRLCKEAERVKLQMPLTNVSEAKAVFRRKNRACQQHSHNANFHWNFQKYLVSILCPIIV